MKHSKTLALLVAACMLTAMISVVSCESNSPTASLDEPQLSVPIIIVFPPALDAGPRLNGTQFCATCGDEHQLWAIGYGAEKKHFCTEAGAQSYFARLKNGDR